MTTYSIGNKLHSIEATGSTGRPIRVMTNSRDTFCGWLIKDAETEFKKAQDEYRRLLRMKVYWLVVNTNKGELRGSFNSAQYDKFIDFKKNPPCSQQTTPSLMQQFITALKLKRITNTITNACAAVKASIRATVRKYLK